MAFIVFEGGDGAGKSTQARALFRRLQRASIPVLLTREPGGTPLGESLRRLLKRRSLNNPLSELLLFQAARAQLVEAVIRPALSEDTHVICDRFTSSTVAYQGFGRGLDLGMIEELNGLATGGVVPGLIVLLDLAPDVLAQRRRVDGNDAFEAESLEFRKRVREGYLAQAAAAPDRWLVLDATRARADLAEEIWQKVRPLL